MSKFVAIFYKLDSWFIFKNANAELVKIVEINGDLLANSFRQARVEIPFDFVSISITNSIIKYTCTNRQNTKNFHGIYLI